MTAALRHEPRLFDGGEVCSCGRDECPELRAPYRLECEDPRRHAVAIRAGRCEICDPRADGSDAALAWALAVELAGAGRRAAVDLAVAEVRAGRSSAYIAGEALARHDLTLRTDLELALARRRRR